MCLDRRRTEVSILSSETNQLGSCAKSPNGQHSLYYLDEEDIYDKTVKCTWCYKVMEVA